MYFYIDQLNLNRKGFGLIEVVIAVAILSVVMLGVTTMMISSQNGAQSVTKRLDAGQLNMFITAILSNQVACMNSGLIGQTAPPATPPATPDTVSVPTLTFAGLKFDDSTNNLFDNGQLKIQSLKYHSVTVLGNTSTIDIRMQVNTQGSGTQTIVGGNTLAPVDFPLIVTTSGGLITSCGSSSNVQVASLGANTCTAAGNSRAGSHCTNTVFWAPPFVDTNYQVNCSLIGPITGSCDPRDSCMWIADIEKFPDHVVVYITSGESNQAHDDFASDISCTAIHP